MKKIRFVLILLSLLTASCATVNSNNVLYYVTETPEEIRSNVVSFAWKYVERDTVYEWGGRDSLDYDDPLGVDCSGFIVRVYQYASRGTGYSLLFRDTNVSSLYEYFTVPLESPAPGDFIFMGDSLPPTHMGIFIKEEGGYIYFIDATEKDADEINGYDAVNGVTFRYYPKDDPRFLSFARLLIKYGGR